MVTGHLARKKAYNKINRLSPRISYLKRSLHGFEIRIIQNGFGLQLNATLRHRASVLEPQVTVRCPCFVPPFSQKLQADVNVYFNTHLRNLKRWGFTNITPLIVVRLNYLGLPHYHNKTLIR